jgi:hypothetical protein
VGASFAASFCSLLDSLADGAIAVRAIVGERGEQKVKMGGLARRLPRISPAHDPEKCAAVFPRDKRGTRLRGDHAQAIDQSAMTKNSAL